MSAMNFNIVFQNTNDVIPFRVIYNHDLMVWFINKANQENCNRFFNNDGLDREIDQRLSDINSALSKTNEIYWILSGENFPQNTNLEDYLDQRFLNRQHALWVESQRKIIDIDQMRYSENVDRAKIGAQLHDLYPDEIRKVRLAPIMQKLGYIYPYEEVNQTVHRLENIFSKNREYSSHNKWADMGFDNPFLDKIVSNLDTVNFSFGYTYVGRQFYNKWQYWDSDLEFADHYNYEKLEWSFQLNLDRPQTRPWSQEFLDWTRYSGAKLIAPQLPIANVIDLERNLTKYRKILYNNARQNNQASLIIE
jgi:hypothetical protein